MGKTTNKRTAGTWTRAMEVKRVDAERRAVDAVMSTGVVDRHGEAIEPKAFAALLPEFAKNPVLLADHDHTKQIGHWENVKVTDGGLEGTAVFAETALAEEHWALYAGGHRKAFSVGFLVHESKQENRTVDGVSRRVRVFTKVELLECSSVAIPANREALVVMALGGDGGAADGAAPEPDAEPGDAPEPGAEDERATLTVGAARRLLAEAIEPMQTELRALQAQLPEALGDALDQRAGREAHRGIFDEGDDSSGRGDGGGPPTLGDYFGR